MTEAPIDGTGGNTKRGIAYPSKEELPFTDSAHQGTLLNIGEDSHLSTHSIHHVAPSIWEDKVSGEKPVSDKVKRDAVPFLPGNLFCPEAGNDITSSENGTDCTCYDDYEANDPFGTGVLTRRNLFENDTISGPLRVLATDSNLRTCPFISIPIPAYQNTPIVAYYDLANPTTLNPVYGPYTPTVPVNLGANNAGRPYMVIEGNKVVYAREHPYEVSMGMYFLVKPFN